MRGRPQREFAPTRYPVYRPRFCDFPRLVHGFGAGVSRQSVSSMLNYNQTIEQALGSSGTRETRGIVATTLSVGTRLGLSEHGSYGGARPRKSSLSWIRGWRRCTPDVVWSSIGVATAFLASSPEDEASVPADLSYRAFIVHRISRAWWDVGMRVSLGLRKATFAMMSAGLLLVAGFGMVGPNASVVRASPGKFAAPPSDQREVATLHRRVRASGWSPVGACLRRCRVTQGSLLNRCDGTALGRQPHLPVQLAAERVGDSPKTGSSATLKGSNKPSLSFLMRKRARLEDRSHRVGMLGWVAKDTTSYSFPSRSSARSKRPPQMEPDARKRRRARRRTDCSG